MSNFKITGDITTQQQIRGGGISMCQEGFHGTLTRQYSRTRFLQYSKRKFSRVLSQHTDRLRRPLCSGNAPPNP
jgi:hypothetical protein